jgi:hypothetical protein
MGHDDGADPHTAPFVRPDQACETWGTEWSSTLGEGSLVFSFVLCFFLLCHRVVRTPLSSSKGIYCAFLKKEKRNNKQTCGYSVYPRPGLHRC